MILKSITAEMQYLKVYKVLFKAKFQELKFGRN